MRDVKGYEGLYAVTSCGKVWSYRKSKFLKTFKNEIGYIIVDLVKDNTRKHYRVHRLVAQAYIQNPNNLPEVNHKNENKLNNNINNLEWCTKEYNLNYGTRNLRIGNKNAKSKMKPCICIELNEVFDSAKIASEKTGISYSNIKNVLCGRNKTAKGYHFEYI